MISEEILKNNLNSTPYKDYFAAFGYDRKEQVYLRRFNDKDREDKGWKYSVDMWNFESIIPELQRQNSLYNGIFYVVNGGGQEDKAVKQCRAQFIDFDDFPFEEQIRRLNAFPLEPSIVVKTRKSLHCYWIIENGDISLFREIQKRLIQYFKSDVTIKNESRVMRLYGFNHCKSDPIMVTLIKFDPGLRYTQQDLHNVLPLLEKRKSGAESVKKSGELVPYGQRHYYVMKRIGEYVSKIGKTTDDETILELVVADFLKNCQSISSDDMDDFRDTYLEAIIQCRSAFDAEQKDPDFYKYALKAWKAENPGKEFNTDETSWDEVAAAGRRAKEKGLLFEKPKKELILSQKGDPLSILPNYAEILRIDHAGQIWLNALDNRIMLEKFSWDVKSHPVRDIDLFNILNIFVEKYDFRNKENAKMALSIVAYENVKHPVVEMLKSLKWDGQPRIANLFPKYLGADRTGYTTAATKLLLYGAIQRVMHPGIKFDYCIILADTVQGTGKSTMCRFLAISDDWFCDSLSEMNNEKTAYEAIRGHWIIELGEMIATRRTKDIEAIKAYISREADDYRDPYGVFPERRPRQCIFVGTSNKPQFLPDDKTGNRRFIPIICDGKKAEVHPRENEAETREYIRQCYAEALQTGEAEGWPLVLGHEFDEQLNAIREASTPDDPDLGIVQEWLDKCGKQYVCSRLIWDEAFKGDQTRQPTRAELQNISDLMNLKITGWHKYLSKSGKSDQMKFEKYGGQRAWERDNLVNSPVNTELTRVDSDGFLIPSTDDELPF